MAVWGTIPRTTEKAQIEFDSTRALATCLKPADDTTVSSLILRIWETTGDSGPLIIGLPGFKRAFLTDLLERDQAELQIVNGKATIDLKGHGFSSLRLTP